MQSKIFEPTPPPEVQKVRFHCTFFLAGLIGLFLGSIVLFFSSQVRRSGKNNIRSSKVVRISSKSETGSLLCVKYWKFNPSGYWKLKLHNKCIQ
ncbi:hypothetical protein Glove_123g188 [Diversispora epigaea]|uniref:Uncharacterized protein n=1 Tax=Diversispora epigaea TaxID=1348612 RepID=A0A397IYI2_9GLOM|nr:hypothetical protein Glove_123g188 [Diversispora epigaea]